MEQFFIMSHIPSFISRAEIKLTEIICSAQEQFRFECQEKLVSKHNNIYGGGYRATTRKHPQGAAEVDT